MLKRERGHISCALFLLLLFVFPRTSYGWQSVSIEAHALAVQLGRTFAFCGKTQLAAQYVVGSGDRNPRDGRHGTFDGVFGGTDTILYGWMNLFSWQNVREHRLEMIMTPRASLSVRAEYHYFMLDQPKDAWYDPGKVLRRDSAGTSGRELGQEMDLTVRKKLFNRLEFLGGWCFFLPGEFIQKTGESPMAHWYFLETTFNF